MIEDTIRRFLIDELPSGGSAANLPNDFPLIEQGVLDSLGLFQLVGYLENEFGVDIEDEELVIQNFGTIRDIAALVQAKREAE